MALAWAPSPRSDEQPVLLRPLPPPRAPTVFQAAPPFERIDPPTPRALARLAAGAAAAPALMPPPAPMADADDEAPALMPPPPPRFVPPADDDDDRSVASASSAALGIESSATSFSARDDLLAPPPPFEPPDDDDDDEERSIVEDDISTVGYDSGDDTATYVGEGGARTTSSRFWGVCWNRERKKWQARYRDADGKDRTIGYYDDEEEAARARDQAIRDAGLQGKRRMNVVEATGALVPKAPGPHNKLERSAVVAPDAARAPTATSSKFWGVHWNKRQRRWQARYKDANGKRHGIGLYDTQEQAAHAVNAAIRRAGLEGRRKTNPVVDGQLVPRALKAPGHGPRYKRRREEAAAAAPRRARRPRRAANDDSEPDADDD